MAGRGVDVDPAREGEQARHGVQPLAVGAAQLRLAATQDGERDDLSDRLHEHEHREQHVDHGGEREEAADRGDRAHREQ